MLQLLKVEWLKLKNYRTFWILSVMYIISNYGIMYIVHLIFQDITRDIAREGGGVARGFLGAPFEFPDIWHTAAYWCSFLLFIPGLLLITSITNEFSYKTHRQNVVDGWSRRQFILVKLGLVAVMSLIATLVVFLTALIFGLQLGSSLSFEKIEFILYFFIQSLSYLSVALVFSLLIRRSGLTIGVYFLYVFLLDELLGRWLSRGIKNAGHYFPLDSADSLVPFPFVRRLAEGFIYQPNYGIFIPLTIAYLALYFIFCVRKFETDDL